jgi:outer membrane protein assembly factor BamB
VISLATLLHMAQGRWKSYLLAVVIILIVLATTHTWNPWPKLWNWFNTSSPIAAGASQWQQRIGGSPQKVQIAADAVIVSYRTSVEAYGLGAGVKLWNNDADWASVAGQGSEAVVVTGRLLTKGYQVLDPRSGAVKRADTSASAVWTYQDAILDLSCAKGSDCTLSAWAPNGTQPRWQVSTGGIGFVLDAADPDLPDTRQLTGPGIDNDVAGRGELPGLIGLPDDGKVRVINTATGKVSQTVTPGTGQKVVVVGGRVLTVTGTAADGTCYYGVVATDPPAGQTVWQRDGLNLRTAGNGSGCKQDRDPAGGEDVVLGVDPVGKEELIAAHDGRILWHGDKGETVLSVNDAYALIRSANHGSVRAFSFATGGTAWRRDVGANVSAAVTPYASIVVTTKPSRIVALDPRSGSVLVDVKTDAKVFTSGTAGLIVVSGRDMAYLPFR